MKISVVTVSYNSAATIVEALRSVALQSHEDVEHIVVDGGSSDQTVTLIRANSSRVACLVSEPDKGIYDAMNKGLRLATGDMVGFLNSDDIFGSLDVLRWISEAASDTKVDAVYGDLLYVSNADPARVIRRWRSGDYAPSRLRRGWMPPHPTLYVRRQRHDNADMFDTTLRIAADYDFMLRLFSNRKLLIKYVPKVFVRMRTGGASNRSIHALWNKSVEDLRVLHRHNVGGLMTLVYKNLRKLPQFLARFDSKPIE